MANKASGGEGFSIFGNIVDIHEGEIYHGSVHVSNGIISRLDRQGPPVRDMPYIMPGFVDSHVHVESSMLVPAEFARVAVAHGTVAAVADPHEIANVLGVSGVDYMLKSASGSPMKFYFAAPSCVPASSFETSGAVLGPAEVDTLLSRSDITHLGEVMNFPGVLSGDEDITMKIKSAVKHGKPVDGHAPGLSGEGLRKYASAGISTDHECTTIDEALEKISAGMKIQIREGSAARNFEELAPLLNSHPERCMLCTDDIHPDDLLRGHINTLVKRALAMGIDIVKVMRAASLNPVEHYNLDVGLLRQGDPADFIVVDSLGKLNVIHTYIDGKQVLKDKNVLLPPPNVGVVNNFSTSMKSPEDIAVPYRGGRIKVIVASEGQLITGTALTEPLVQGGFVVSDTRRDILKMTVVNRYYDAPPAVGFVSGFGLKEGAIASSVAHDSHNIVAVGVGDEDIPRAVNMVIENRGGICAVRGDEADILPLPVAGIMSDKDCSTTAERYGAITHKAREMGCGLKAPFMTLSFMALVVIPHLKLSDRGLFDVDSFAFTDLAVE